MLWSWLYTVYSPQVNLWMFPEGHRNMMKQREDHMLPFKKGAFNIAVKAQVQESNKVQ